MNFHYNYFLQEDYHARSEHFRDFSVEEQAQICTRLPEWPSQFLIEQGLSSFGQGFLFSVLPSDLDAALGAWGLKTPQHSAILRSAWGGIVGYHQKNKQYFLLDPILGRLINLDDDFYLIINYSLRLSAILEAGLFQDVFLSRCKDLGALQADEVFALRPAIAQGGDWTSSSLEKAGLVDQLCFLAGLWGGKAKKIKI